MVAPTNNDGAIFDMGQERILLPLIEAVHLIDKKQRFPPLGIFSLTGLLNRVADIFDTTKNRRKGDEGDISGFRQQPRKSRLSDARWSP